MPADTQSSSGNPASKPKAGAAATGKKELKILMLHGYTQSGPLFKAKTGALSKPLTKALALPPISAAPTLIYPTGPHRLRPSDIPGFAGAAEGEGDAEAETDCWAWFRRDDATGTYRGFDEGMQRVAEAIRGAGGIDGVIGFSQGGATAALVAAALEPGRAVPEGAAAAWAGPLREANGGRGLRFAVVYSGFVARDEQLAWLYEGGVRTPSLHFLGGLDTVVEESRSTALVDVCKEARTVVHPGGHYVPVSKEWVGVLAGFLREVLGKADESAAEGTQTANI